MKPCEGLFRSKTSLPFTSLINPNPSEHPLIRVIETNKRAFQIRIERLSLVMQAIIGVHKNENKWEIN